MKKYNQLTTKRITRNITIRSADIVPDSKYVYLSFASKEPCLCTRDYTSGYPYIDEILDVSPKAMRTDRLKNGANVLVDHDSRDVVGIVESDSITIDEEKGIARAKVRFGDSARAREIHLDVVQGIRKNVSVGFDVHAWRVAKEINSRYPDCPTVLVTDWEPMEISIVAVPADPTVGVGRSQKQEKDQMTNQVENMPTVADKQTQVVASTMTKEAIKVASEAKKADVTTEKTVASVKMVENKSAREISDLTKDKPYLQGLAIDAISRGLSKVEFMELALKEMPESQSVVPQRSAPLTVDQTRVDPGIGMTRKETGNFSFTRLLRGLIMMQTNPWEARNIAGFELDCVTTANREKAYRGTKTHSPYTIPHDVMVYSRDAVTSTTNAPLISTDIQYGSLIHMLLDKLVFPQAGIGIRSGLTGNQSIPKLTSGVDTVTVGRDGKAPESSLTSEVITMTPRTATSRIQVNRSALVQDAIGLENVIKNKMVESMTNHLQKMIISGSGSNNEPQGILKFSGINKLPASTNGKKLTWDDVVKLRTLVADKNADFGKLSYITNDMVKGALLCTPKVAGTSGMIWSDNNERPLVGQPAYVTNAMPSNLSKGTANGTLSSILFGNMEDIIMGFWTGMELLVDPYTKSDQNAIRIAIFQDYDIVYQRVESFSVCNEVIV